MGTALAGGVIATAFLEALYDKGLLNRQEAREVLASAMISLGNVAQAGGGRLRPSHCRQSAIREVHRGPIRR